MRLTTLFFATAMLAMPTPVRAQAPTAPPSARRSPDDELRHVEQDYLDARLRNDKTALARLIADNYISIGSSGQVLGRSFAIQVANATPGGDSLRSMTIDSVQVRRIGSTAIVIGRRNIDTANGPAALRFLHVFEKKNGRWQLVASSTTPIR